MSQKQVKQLKVRNPLNFDFTTDVKPEKNTQPSETVPDQAMSIREILDRYAKGLPLSGARVPVFDEEDDMPDVRGLDLAERQEVVERYLEELKILKQRESDRQAEFQRFKQSEKEKAQKEPEAEKEPKKPQKQDASPQPGN